MLMLLGELLSIARALNAAGLDYALCGGFALAVHGHPRFTKDIDLIVRAEDVTGVQEVVAGLGYRLRAAPMTFGAGTRHPRSVHRVSKVLSDRDDLVTLDLLVLDESFEDVWRTREGHEVDGCLIQVVSREGLMRLKQAAGRGQDLLDLRRLAGEAPDEETHGGQDN
jgi:hypothetical protein